MGREIQKGMIHEPSHAEKPVRIQLRRTKGFRLQEASRAINGLDCVKVDRTTRYGNDYTIEDYGDAATAVDLFDHDLDKFSVFHPGQYRRWIAPLVGKNLACWCAPGAVCHADVLLRRAAEYEKARDGSSPKPTDADA